MGLALKKCAYKKRVTPPLPPLLPFSGGTVEAEVEPLFLFLFFFELENRFSGISGGSGSTFYIFWKLMFREQGRLCKCEGNKKRPDWLGRWIVGIPLGNRTHL